MKPLLDEMFTSLWDHFMLLGWEAYTVDDTGLKGAGDMEEARTSRKMG